MTVPSQPLRIPLQGKIPRRTSPASFFGLSIFRFVTLAALLLTQPSLVRAGNILKGCATSYDPTRDYFPEKVRVTEAEDFGVEYHLNYKLATNFRTGETFALYQCGTPAPAGLNSTIKVFPVPFQSVGLTTTIEISFLEKLGLTTAIKYISGPEYISSPCLQALITSGETIPFSDNSTIMAIQEQNVDGVFDYSDDPSNPKHISVSTSLDPGALHRAEWIGFLGLFFNAEASAETIFDEIQANFDCVSNLAKKNPSSPVVAWVSYAGYQINKYTISTAQYKLDFVEALGATPLAPQVHEFDKLDDWKAAMANVDIVIDETYLGNIDTFFTNFGLNSDSTTFKFVKNGQVWGIDKLQSDLGALDWFETAVASPDAVLQDLYTIVKPEDHFNHTRIWLRDSFHREAPVTTGSEKCPNPSAALVSPASPCPPLDDGSGSGFALVHPFGFLMAFCLAFIALLTLA